MEDINLLKKDIILFKKEIARLNIQLGQTQMYVTELEEKIESMTKYGTIKHDDISNDKIKST